MPSAPVAPCQDRLQCVVPDAEGLSVGRVQVCSVVLALDDVVGDEPRRQAGRAALSVLVDPLATATGTEDDVGSPYPVLD